jgi:hypothetical protein
VPIAENTIFKLVSLRKPIDGLTVDPADDVSDSQVEKLLSGSRVDPANPTAEVLRRVADLPVLTEADLQRSILAFIQKHLQAEKVISFSGLTSIQIEHNGVNMSLAEFSATQVFADSYRDLTDSWLTRRLRIKLDPLVDQHEDLIKIAHLCLRLRTSPDSLREPGVLDQLLRALVVFPRNWRPARYRQQELRAKHSARLAEMPPPTTSARAKNIAQKKREYAELVRRIALLESIQSKASASYTQWKKERVDANPTSPARAGQSRRRGGLVQRVSNFIFGTRATGVSSQVTSVVRLDENFYSRLENRLTEDEKGEIGDILKKRPPFFNDILPPLDPGKLVIDANDACAAIKVWEDEETQEPPEIDTRKPGMDRPSVRAIGFGDLIVARERLVGYEAHEIAHIENILSGEEKVYEHERKNKTVQVTEIETTKNTETDRELQTTNRYELQTEAQKTVNQEFSIQAGVNTSGRYGLTEVETSLDAGFQQSQSESRSSSVQLAKDIVSRSVERTFESVRELRRLTITEQIRELNTHSVKNIPAEGAPAVNPPSRSGVYLWVEKIHEVELRQYGKRVMVEFHIPEPALSLLGLDNPDKKNIRKPAPLKVGPNDINHGNYLCLSKLYGAQDVEPPPAQFIQVGFPWASTPDENVDKDTAEESVGDTISIPAGYRPVSGTVIVSTIKAEFEDLDAYLAVGGQTVITFDGTSEPKPYKQDDFNFDPIALWPQGVPVSLVSHGAFDKTLIAQITLKCERTAEAFTDWQLRTWEKIRAAHQVLVREFERAIEEANFSNPAVFNIQGRPEAENRQIEIEELKKWAIKTMRLTPFDYDAVVQVGDHPEIDPLDADFQAPIVRFFEEAFEWRQMTYFLYPYFWGRRDAWRFRQQITDPDPRYEAFLRAGAARVIVPITPGYEERALFYLDSNPDPDKELQRISGPPDPKQIPPADSEAEDLWLELLVSKNEELALGSGTLRVQKNQTLVTINEDSTWLTSDRDLGREIYIDGDSYTVASISTANKRQFNLDEPCKGETDDDARYATGSVPYGPPWLVRIPTSLVILSEETSKLADLSK